MIQKYRNPLRTYLKEIRYKVIRLKYFLLVVAAMFLEIIVLITYLLSNENVLKIDFFNLKILFGFISAIIIIISIAIIIILKLDKTKDRNMIKQYRDFKRKHYEVLNKHMPSINRAIKEFDKEIGDLERKIELALTITNLYKELIQDYSEIKVPGFIESAYEKEKEHFIKEQLYFDKFSSFEDNERLVLISQDSEESHNYFIKELNRIENSLKLVM